MTKSRGLIAPRSSWQPWELEMLRRHYPDKRTEWVARAVRRSVRAVYAMASMLELKKSEAFLASPEACRLRRGDQVGKASRFTPGHVPANKEMRGRPSTGRMAETQFKAGTRPHTYLPIGTVNTDTEGYVKVKLRDPNVWGYMAQLVWASTHPWPLPKGFVITYRDGDRSNCHPDNLVLATKRDFMERNTIHNYPEPLKTLIRARASLVRKINDHEQDRRCPKRAVQADGTPDGS